MKILITTLQLNRGGKEKQLMVLASGLIKRNVDVFILTITQPNQHNFYHEYLFPSENIISLNDKSYFRGFWKFRKSVKEISPDLILTYDIQTTLWATCLKPLLKIPVINHSIQRGTTYPRKEQRILRFVARKSKINIANSAAGLTMLNLPENKHNRIIYSPLIGAHRNDNCISFSSLFGVKRTEKTKVIINVGSISHHKGQQYIFDAIATLNDPNLFLIFIGDGPIREELSNQIEASKFNNNVHFTGNIDNVGNYLEMADYYVHASKGEGSSNALLEALHAGLPVISTLNGGTEEIAQLVDIQTINNNNKQSLIDQFIRIQKNEISPPDIEPLKKRYLDENKYVDSFLKIFHTLLNEKI